MAVHTVLGPIPAASLGPTSMHEHVLSDLRAYAKEPSFAPPAATRLGPELRSHLTWDGLSVPENLVLHDPGRAIAELALAHDAGAHAVVELTLPGMGRRLEELPAIARASGVAICVGTGLYVDEMIPEAYRRLDETALAEAFVRDLVDGIGADRVKPALIGEVGTSYPVTEAEWRTVRAAGHAAARTGASVSVHTSWRGHAAIEILDVLIGLGVPADRVVIGHLDESFDPGYHRELAQAGAMLGYDTFGNEFFFGRSALRSAPPGRTPADAVKRMLGRLFPSDAERLAMISWCIEEGIAGQLIVGSDVWTQLSMHANGGHGYDHLFRHVAPAITALAGDDGALRHRIMVENPRRLLDRP